MVDETIEITYEWLAVRGLPVSWRYPPRECFLEMTTEYRTELARLLELLEDATVDTVVGSVHADVLLHHALDNFQHHRYLDPILPYLLQSLMTRSLPSSDPSKEKEEKATVNNEEQQARTLTRHVALLVLRALLRNPYITSWYRVAVLVRPFLLELSARFSNGLVDECQMLLRAAVPYTYVQ